MDYKNGCFVVYNNAIKPSHSHQAIKRQEWMKKKFHYNPDEKYTLRAVENGYLGNLFGLKDILRQEDGEPIDEQNGVICSTIRMGFGHYRIAIAAASCAHAMGYTPYWLDLLAIPGITTDIINYCNHNYSFFSRLSQRNRWFNKYIWEAITTGGSTLPILSNILNSWIIAWPWRYLKTNVKDYLMSELFKNLHEALPPHIPVLTSHMWNCMGAVAGGMTNVVDLMFDNWPMAFQLTEGARHAVQSPSGYYGFRVMRGFDEENKIMNPVPAEALFYTGHHVDHELVDNIEIDCSNRLQRMENGEPRRFLVTMGGAGAQRELFKAIIEHGIPLVKNDKISLFVNLGDHKDNLTWLETQLPGQHELLQLHNTWEDTRSFADHCRNKTVRGVHIFLFDNTFHAVYSTNYLMRVSDVMITKPSELSFYPIPKIFNERVGGHEMWGAIRGAEIGDGTLETRTIPQTLQAIDLITHENDLLTLYCDCIVKNKRVGIYDGAYHSVALATGKKFERP